MKNKNCVYIFVTADEYELPIAIADTLEEISELVGYRFGLLYQALKRNSVINCKYRIREVDIRDPEEKFIFEEYNKFCLKENLSPSNFKNLMRFRRECFGS